MPYCDEITNLNNRKWDSFQGPVCIKIEKIRDKSKTGEWIDSPPHIKKILFPAKQFFFVCVCVIETKQAKWLRIQKLFFILKSICCSQQPGPRISLGASNF